MPWIDRPPDRVITVSAEAMSALEDVSHKIIQYDITQEEGKAEIDRILSPFLDKPLDPNQYTQIVVKPKTIIIGRGSH